LWILILTAYQEVTVTSDGVKDTSLKAKTKDSTLKAKAKDSTLKAKTKDFAIVLEDPRE